MGLFDFIKKKKGFESQKLESDGAPEASKSIFKGDLASLDDRPRYEGDPYETEESEYQGDSSDSVVFMNFPAQGQAKWLCPECGTLNDENMNGCAVCGLKKK